MFFPSKLSEKPQSGQTAISRGQQGVFKQLHHQDGKPVLSNKKNNNGFTNRE
jgi:hypothetical protein